MREAAKRMPGLYADLDRKRNKAHVPEWQTCRGPLISYFGCRAPTSRHQQGKTTARVWTRRTLYFFA